jgi:branched-chain amino acid transport system permease protein
MIIKRADAVLLAILAVVVLLVPFTLGDYWVLTFGSVGAITLAVIGLNVAMGWAGLLSFGQPVFMALGGYASAILATRYSVNPWLALLAGIALSAAVAAVIGFPVLKLESHYFAVATFAMSLIVLSVVNGAQGFTGGATGITGIPPLTIGSVSFADHVPYYILVWVLVVLALLATYAVRASRTGRAFRVLATRPDVAASLGIGVRRYRVIAFVISAVLASVAGSLIVEFSTYASPDNFNGDVGILIFAMLFIGGIRTASGPIIGAAIVTVLPVEATAIGKYSALTFELVLLLILVVWPRGLGISVATGVEDVIERFVKGLGQPRAAGPAGDPDASEQARVSEQAPVSGGRDHG